MIARLLTLLAVAHLVVPPQAAAKPPCRDDVGPPSCAAAHWICMSPDKAAILPARLQAERERCEIERGAMLAEHDTILRTERAKHRVEIKAWDRKHRGALELVGHLEGELRDRDTGHSTFVLVVSVVGAAVVAGLATGLVVHYAH